MFLIPNFQPFLALAMCMPFLTDRKELQYGIPIIALALYYVIGPGLDIAQLGYFASLSLVTFLVNKFSLLKAYLIGMFGYHILANISHGNPFTLSALEFDVSTFTATAFYLFIFITARKIHATKITGETRS